MRALLALLILLGITHNTIAFKEHDFKVSRLDGIEDSMLLSLGA